MDIVGAANATPIRRMDFIKGKHKPNSPEGIDFLKIIQESNPPVYEAIRGLNPRRIQVDTENKLALLLQDNPAVQRFIRGENDRLILVQKVLINLFTKTQHVNNAKTG